MALLPSIDAAECEAMLVLARQSLEAHWQGTSPQAIPELPHGEERRGCFVTLHKDGLLRGCIGTLEPTMRLKDAIPHFACASAFEDPRFPPVREDELPQLVVSISILSDRSPLPADSRAELLASLHPGEDGLWLSDGLRRATFLPSVWRQLPQPDSFINHLLIKGGWHTRGWPTNLQAWRYVTLEFGEAAQAVV